MNISVCCWYVDHGFNYDAAACTKISDTYSHLELPLVASRENVYSLADQKLVSKPSFCAVNDKHFSTVLVPGW